MSSSQITKLCTAAIAIGGVFIVTQLAAQQPGPAKADRAAASASQVPANSSDATRAKLMASDEWKQISAGYQKWLDHTAHIYAQTDRPNQR